MGGRRRTRPSPATRDACDGRPVPASVDNAAMLGATWPKADAHAGPFAMHVAQLQSAGCHARVIVD